MQIVLATHNRGKMEEMAQILAHLPVTLLTLDSFPEIGDIPEPGESLKENAFIKAETVHRLTGLPALADDTGLEVDALNGAPGVHSSRYAGEDATFEDNCRKMLSELDGLPMVERTARFRTVIAFVTKEEKEWTEGVAEGLILDHKQGDGGFGYDPIFYYPPLKKTFAELEKTEKNSISHRGKALRNFSEILEKRIQSFTRQT
ncbi:MAG: XTP/dITP diphosphatase [Candidatus Marinimicrobia bacterium]|nr:XTP/dITP diphosphatase [Candidatus Neomarinimicrobiota bacterium]MBT3675369.1 XTP/dITP diphosphatase [Candidatus Neomarinimicrobiota bacterium]MBT3762356.1 XTP/dITP diphosphatase [Candidatus Neomarinimicrobiota bacterium]MBT4068131.1 XTP/dITP diphosphatase [Candidatus Neomarinimicrobiota bacterium]MBT4271022.1 XTP/dITP diphosphatase [Candidatus Neomarinimicrobiota bacterium]